MKSNCYHEQGHDAACSYPDSIYMLLFGVVQIIMSQIPNFHDMAWLSVVAAIMSFAYSIIGLGLGFAKVIGTSSCNLDFLIVLLMQIDISAGSV